MFMLNNYVLTVLLNTSRTVHLDCYKPAKVLLRGNRGIFTAKSRMTYVFKKDVKGGSHVFYENEVKFRPLYFTCS